jgi:cell volume regulation protein A
MTVGGAILVYSATSTAGGSGFLAVYVTGLVMGNSVFLHKKSLTRFHDGLGWMMQIAMFLTLGLLIFPSALMPVAPRGALLALFLILVARPASVFVALAFSKVFAFREKLMISWLGLRGAAPIILATFPLLSGLSHADAIFNLVFFIVIISVVLQGPAIPWIAKELGVAAPASVKARAPMEFEPMSATDTRLTEIIVPKDSKALGKSIVSLGMPEGALVVLITRANEFVVPRGQTEIRPEDTLLVLANKEDLATVRSLVGSTVL